MNTKLLFSALTLTTLLVASGMVVAAPAPVGEITGVTASKSLVTVGEAVTVTLHGTVKTRQSCQIHIFRGYVSNSDLDAGLVSAFPKTVSNLPIKFDKPGTYTIRAYGVPTTAGMDSTHYCSYNTLTNGAVVIVKEGISPNPGLTVTPADPGNGIRNPARPPEPGHVSVPPDPYQK